jgi:hypothetical protein
MGGLASGRRVRFELTEQTCQAIDSRHPFRGVDKEGRLRRCEETKFKKRERHIGSLRCHLIALYEGCVSRFAYCF